MHPTFVARIGFPILVILTLAAAPAFAVTLDPGYSFFQVEPGSAFLDFTTTPIPADAFGPGSDPFVGLIELEGRAVGPVPDCTPAELAGVHAILDRQGVVDLPDPSSTAEIPLEITALRMHGVDPIVVTFNGGQDPTPVEIVVESPLTDPAFWSVSYWTPIGVGSVQLESFASDMSNGLKFYFTTDPEDLVPIVQDIAASIPLATVQKHAPRPKQPPACESTSCMNQEEPLTVLGDFLEFQLRGVCDEGPVAIGSTSWGMVKTRYGP